MKMVLNYGVSGNPSTDIVLEENFCGDNYDVNPIFLSMRHRCDQDNEDAEGDFVDAEAGMVLTTRELRNIADTFTAFADIIEKRVEESKMR